LPSVKLAATPTAPPHAYRWAWRGEGGKFEAGGGGGGEEAGRLAAPSCREEARSGGARAAPPAVSSSGQACFPAPWPFAVEPPAGH
jgi:hypothetical protein